MGKKGGWFYVVKKVLSPESKKDQQKTPKSKKKWFGKDKELAPDSFLPVETKLTVPPHTKEDYKLTGDGNEHAYSLALATAMAAEAAFAAAQAAAEVVRLTSAPRPAKSKEELAAIKIQTAFRGYLARRALRALRGLVRLKSMIQGQSVKQQATTTLKCMQTLANVQSQIRARRIRMSEENQGLLQQLQQKRENEVQKLTAYYMAEDWNDSRQSKEQIEARQQNKKEADMRRERSLAYAFSQQQSRKSSSKTINPTFMDPNSPQWGWSWLEQWMEARPWESGSTTDHNNDRGSVKSMGGRSMSIGEISRAYSRRDLNNNDNNNRQSQTATKSVRPPSRQSPSTPHSRAPSISSLSRLPSTKGSRWGGDHEDSRSMLTDHRYRRRSNSIAGSSLRDDESLVSSPASVPSYMAPTQSTKARSRMPSLLGRLEINGTPERGLAGSAKKRLSFPASPIRNWRLSGSPGPKVDIIITPKGN